MKKIITIDGSQGEGGGQILRTSLSLAMCLGLNIHIKNIRAGRRKPGLMRQHFTCVEAARELCAADVAGSYVGSTELEFKANAISEKNKFDFKIGTSGSTTLVFQTVLPALLLKKSSGTVNFVGGTHNMMAPTYDFIEHAFLPTLSSMGLDIESELKQPGFYPVGGGIWNATVNPSEANSIDLVERGELLRKRAVACLGNLPRKIAERELAVIKQKNNWDDTELVIDTSHCLGAGNVVSLQLAFETINMEFNEIGEKNRSAEKVANAVCSEMAHYLESGAVVNEHLADQLLLPMALGKGGSFTTTEPSQHLLTNALVIEQLSGIKTRIEAFNEKCWIVEIENALGML